MKIVVLALGLVLIVSCGKSTPSPQEQGLLKAKADSITISAQQTLMQQVSSAIAIGGTDYAVDFCQVKAMSITDSLSKAHLATITRISDKNRNPQNALKTANDKAVFTAFIENKTQIDTLLMENNRAIFYKRITLAMPSCIQCHGNPQMDIEPSTLQKIKSLYPTDKATGYQLQDFRGLWKVTFLDISK